ncbi:MAG TPA: TerB family tellurite resistance protein [Bacteroidales bacterium]|nr:TerB family tellurite resistance protein [Bacteroidales bacterium]
MASLGKWIGGGLGWALGGPIGAILGFLFGSMFDGMQSEEFAYQPAQEVENRKRRYKQQTRTGDFTVSLLILSAAVMNADKRVLKSELHYVRAFLIQQFGEEIAAQQLLMLRELLKQNYNLYEVANQIGQFMDYSSKLQLLHYLFGIAQSDGQINNTEIAVIEQIASLINISTVDFTSVKAMFVKDNHTNYKILEITPDASDEEVKKAYRKMALKYHPDRVSHLGPEIQKAAKEKFQELNAAYNAIKSERGFS